MICFKTVLLLVFCNCISIVSINAQVNISGSVKNVDGENLERASIIVYDSNENVLNYTYTDAIGIFKLEFKETPKTEFTISANVLGYAEQKKELKFQTDQNNYIINFSLEEKAETLS